MQPLSIRAALGLAALSVGVWSAPPPVAGAERPTAAEYEQRIERLEQDLQELKKDTRKLEVGEEEKARLKPVAGWQDGFFIGSPDGANKISLGGYVHFDQRYFFDKTDQGTTQFTFRRVRLDIKGTFLKYFDFRVMPDFAGGRVVLQDAYLNIKYYPWLRPQFGKFKTPAGLERLQSATALTFIERAFPTSILPNRDLGLALGGDLLNAALNYQVGIFDGVRDGASNDNDTDVTDEKTFAGRVFALPFKDTPLVPLRGFGIGVAGTYGKHKGNLGTPELPAFRTTGQNTFFSYVTDSPATADGTAIARGGQTRISPQAYWYWGPFGSMFEYAWSEQEVRKGMVQEDIQHDAWHVRAEWVVTGENASYKGVAPANPFNPFENKWGAFHIAARGSQLHVNQDAFDLGFANPTRSAKSATEWALATNWWWSKNVMFALNFSRTTFNGGLGMGDRKNEEVLLGRVQFVL